MRARLWRWRPPIPLLLVAPAALLYLGLFVAPLRQPHALFLSPLSVPGIVLGIALLQFYATYGIPRTGLTLALAHLVITTPYKIRLVSVSLAGFDQNLERAACSLGASGWTTFRLVTLPLIRPGILAGAVFAFIVSFDDLAVPLFLSSPGAMTLPERSPHKRCLTRPRRGRRRRVDSLFIMSRCVVSSAPAEG